MAQPGPLYGDGLLKGLLSATLVAFTRKLAMLLDLRISKDYLPALLLPPLKVPLQTTGSLHQELVRPNMLLPQQPTYQQTRLRMVLVQVVDAATVLAELMAVAVAQLTTTEYGRRQA